MKTKIKIGVFVTACIALTAGASGYGQHYARTNGNSETVKEIKVEVKLNREAIVENSAINREQTVTLKETAKILDRIQSKL